MEYRFLREWIVGSFELNWLELKDLGRGNLILPGDDIEDIIVKMNVI